MDGRAHKVRFRVGGDLQVRLLRRCFRDLSIFSFNGWRVWARVVSRRALMALFWGVRPCRCGSFCRPFPSSSGSCSVQDDWCIIIGMLCLRFWWISTAPSLVLALTFGALIVSVEACQWMALLKNDGTLPSSDLSLGARYFPLINFESLNVRNNLAFLYGYLNSNLVSIIINSSNFCCVCLTKNRLKNPSLLTSVLWWSSSEATMASKGETKKKKSYKNTLLTASDLVSSIENNQSGSASLPKNTSFLEDAQKMVNKEAASKVADPANNLEQGESSKSKGKMDTASFLNKLTKVKENFQTLQDTSLFGYLIGKFQDFKKKANKLKFEWKNLHGSVDFIDRQMGWFEIRFSNPIDKKQVWDGRPYHIFSQLLLLKPWSPSFDPVSESIYFVDMWVRIPSFPPEYHNFESIKTILEFNNVGTLLKLDLNASKRSWAKFARFCINLDYSKSINKEISIPDAEGTMKKFTLWFEDIPQGCGNCGGLDNNFNSCPSRKFIPPKFKITFKKPSSVGIPILDNHSDDSGWHEVSTKGKDKGESSAQPSKSKDKQMTVYGGIGVIYITDDSSSESKCDQNTETVEPAPLQTEKSDEFCEGLLVETNEGFFLPNNDQTVLVDPNAFSLPPTMEQKDVVANQQYIDEFNKEKEMAAAADNLFFYQEDDNDDWAIDEGEYLVEEPP